MCQYCNSGEIENFAERVVKAFKNHLKFYQSAPKLTRPHQFKVYNLSPKSAADEISTAFGVRQSELENSRFIVELCTTEAVFGILVTQNPSSADPISIRPLVVRTKIFDTLKPDNVEHGAAFHIRYDDILPDLYQHRKQLSDYLCVVRTRNRGLRIARATQAGWVSYSATGDAGVMFDGVVHLSNGEMNEMSIKHEYDIVAVEAIINIKSVKLEDK